ncbi:glycoside hydrolase family 16 protein [Glacieibacterium megasporae]|uniref:glycoside hydrolase family 16 protein n=1 Tax=Glacieibacterium megasporae TaxID=2835787 RepID=UPI001C1E1171|nr:glycoside hydrolase family 16 protein [Polymorphobacter megasporae]UAJ11590.1 glycoside hydrolase family 16 protein [Polymorphobacter megasporae]
MIRATVAALLLSTCGAQATMTPLAMCALRPVFTEDFKTLAIAPHTLADGARWTAHTPWNGDFGDAAFVDPGVGGPFGRDAEGLTITARRDAAGHWTSGLIAAGDATGTGPGVRYGYFEARMKLPPGPGTWPAFWLGTHIVNGDTTPSVELDAIEYYGHNTGGFQSGWHVWPGDKGPGGLHWNKVPADSLTTAFHNYGVRVAPDVTTFYLDRQPVWEIPTPPQHTRPLYPLVNLALGSGYPITDTPNPSVLRVAYVHVYELVPGPCR